MNFKDFINKYYLGEPKYKFYRMYLVLLIFSFVFLVSSTIFFMNLISISDDIIQKNAVTEYDIEQQKKYYVLDADNPDASLDYYRELIIYVPRILWFYLGISFFSMLIYGEFLFYFFYKYYKYRKSLK